MKKTLVIVVLAIVSMMGLSACGGDDGGFNLSREINVISREDGSGTRGAFTELIGLQVTSADGSVVDMTTSEAYIANGTSIVMGNVSGNSYSIGYVSLGSLNDSELENAKAINPVSTSLAKAVDEVMEAMTFAIAEKSIIFETTGDFVIAAEPKHIYELIKNIVENAVRYNNQGGKVTVTIERSKNAAQLTVSDNGIGISSSEQTRIFERFYRVEKSRSVENGGTGLGLSIAKHICFLYGWELSLKSKLGIGTDVTVSFNAY